MSQVLRVSHGDEKQHHEDAIRRILAEYDRLQNRIDAMNVDKLDGRIDTDLFDRKAAEWREEQRKCLALIREHQDANQTYLDEGIRLLELAQKAGALFRTQSPAEKRRLLGFVPSNCIWKDGQLTAPYRQPFELLAKNVIALETKMPAEHAQTGIFDNWLPIVDAYRTICIAPTLQVKAVFQGIREVGDVRCRESGQSHCAVQ